jgi:hypothetical protein
MHNGDEEQFCAPCKPRKRGSEEAGGDVGEGQKKKARTMCKHADGCDKNAKNGGLCAKHGGTQAGPEEEQQEDDDEDDDEDD